MAARYGNRWTSQVGDSPAGLAGAEWAETIGPQTLDSMQCGFTADADRADGWPPSSTEFSAMCVGVPTFAAMRHEMTHGDQPRTPFGLLCWRFVDTYRLRVADQREADRIARDAYDLAKAHVMAGGVLPEVHEALRAPLVPERRPAPPNVAKAHLDAMRGMLSGDDASVQGAGEA